MNQIFDLAEQEFQIKFDMGVKTVRADFMSDHTLSLTFSEHPGANGMMEHLKDIVNGLLNSIPKDRWEELPVSGGQKSLCGKTLDDGTSVPVIVQFAFHDMDVLVRFAKLVDMDELPWNALYRYRKEYRLILDLTGSSEEEVKRLSSLTDEYADEIYVGSDKRAFLLEHGKPILREDAIETLREL
jgi:adapter protein MecA 1/2